MKPISPIRGRWPFTGFPLKIRLGNHCFQRAVWAWEFYPNVREQYREIVPTNSMHLMVMNDGTFEVSHLDDYNPDYGTRALGLHTIFDIIPGAFHGKSV